MKHDINRFKRLCDRQYDIALVNKKILDLRKNENNGVIMIEFVRLRAKMYALRVDSKKDTVPESLLFQKCILGVGK